MIPTNYDDGEEEETLSDFDIEMEPSLTYAMRVSDIESEPGIFLGKTDDEGAIRQAVFKILSTERYSTPIYSWDYGIELSDLRGMPVDYVMSEIPDRITDALTADDRIESCEDFKMERAGKKALHITFSVITTDQQKIEGLEMEVEY